MPRVYLQAASLLVDTDQRRLEVDFAVGPQVRISLTLAQVQALLHSDGLSDLGTTIQPPQPWAGVPPLLSELAQEGTTSAVETSAADDGSTARAIVAAIQGLGALSDAALPAPLPSWMMGVDFGVDLGFHISAAHVFGSDSFASVASANVLQHPPAPPTLLQETEVESTCRPSAWARLKGR